MPTWRSDVIAEGGAVQGITKGSLVEKDENDVSSSNVLTWNVRTEGSILRFEPGFNAFNFVDVVISGLEEGETCKAIWYLEEPAPPYFSLDGVGAAGQQNTVCVRLGPVRFPQQGQTTFEITRQNNQLLVKGFAAESTVSPTINGESSGGHRGLPLQRSLLQPSIASASTWATHIAGTPPSSLSLHNTGGSYIYGHWVWFNATEILTTRSFDFWSEINTNGGPFNWGNVPKSFVAWDRGPGQGVVVPHGGGIVNTAVYELTGKDFSDSANWTTYDISATVGNSKWFISPDRAIGGDAFVMIDSSDGRAYLYTGSGFVVQLGLTGLGSVSTTGSKVAQSSDGQVVVAVGNNQARVSTDGGNTWTPDVTPATLEAKWVTYNYAQGIFCVVGETSPGDTLSNAYLSRNGEDWYYAYAGNEAGQFFFEKVTAMGDFFFANGFHGSSISTGIPGAPCVLWSQDGYNWEPIPGSGTSSGRGYFHGRNRIAWTGSTNEWHVSGSLGKVDGSYDRLF